MKSDHDLPIHRWSSRWPFPSSYTGKFVAVAVLGIVLPPAAALLGFALSGGHPSFLHEALWTIAGAILAAALVAWCMHALLAPVRATLAALAAANQSLPPPNASSPASDEADQLMQAASRQLAALERLTSLKERVTSSIAQDFRGPLTGISLTSELLLTDPSIGIESRPLIDNIKRTTDSQLRQVRRLLEAFLDDIRDAKISSKPIPIPFLWLEVHDTLGVAALQRQIALELVPTDISVLGDSHRLAQVLNNLVANAIKATPPKGRVVVSAVSKGATCEIHVKDNGCGLDPDVYLPLLRLRNSDLSDAQKKKLGLGLRISEALLNVHGSTLQITGKPGSGADLFFELKRA